MLTAYPLQSRSMACQLSLLQLSVVGNVSHTTPVASEVAGADESIESGIGVENGTAGMLDWCQRKSVRIQVG